MLQKIKELIEVLDQRKDESIERTFKGVARNFREVFSELVQGGHGFLVMMKKKVSQLLIYVPASCGSMLVTANLIDRISCLYKCNSVMLSISSFFRYLYSQTSSHKCIHREVVLVDSAGKAPTIC